jgi:PPOX class probable F420-dependent enzyme
VPDGRPDPATEIGARALRQLATDQVAWLTTVLPDGQPQTTTIWFRWTGTEILVYSHRRAHRNANIEANPRVAFNLETDPDGDDYVIVEGLARFDLDGPPASADPDYVAKYGPRIRHNGWTVDWFASEYPFLLRITPTRWRIA